MFGRKSTTSETPAGNGHAEKTKAPAKGAAEDVVSEFEQLWSPEQATARKSVDALLLERGVVTEEQLAQAKVVSAQTPGKSMAQILLTMNAASEAQILSALAETLGMEFVTPSKDGVEKRAFELLPQDYMKKHALLPVKVEGKTLVLGMADPANVFLIDEVKRKTKRDVKVVVVTPADISRTIEVMSAGTSDIKVDDIIKDMSEDDVQVVKDSTTEDPTDLEKAGN